MTSGGNDRGGIVDGPVDPGDPLVSRGLPVCVRLRPLPYDTNIDQRSPTRLWQSAIGWSGVAIEISLTVMIGDVPGLG